MRRGQPDNGQSALFRFTLLLMLSLTACAVAAPRNSAPPAQFPAQALPASSPTPEHLVPTAPLETAAINTLSKPSPTGPAPTLNYPAPGTANPAPLPTIQNPFVAQRAFQDLDYQMSLGPRTPGSQAHTQVIEWMKTELAKNGWTVEDQQTTQNGQPVHNVIAKRGITDGKSPLPFTILGAHFDSRMKADHDPSLANRAKPVPGADDGASGVAVLMELARVLPRNLKGQVWLAFIDSEDQGDLPGWDWILGSRALANSLTTKPSAVIILDMIGDANLNIYKERNSNPGLTDQIWNMAARLGYTQAFIPQAGYSMLDDHTPFLEKNIPAVDIIDFDYPYWHTTADTADKVSPASLAIVGNTMLNWLLETQGK